MFCPQILYSTLQCGGPSLVWARIMCTFREAVLLLLFDSVQILQKSKSLIYSKKFRPRVQLNSKNFQKKWDQKASHALQKSGKEDTAPQLQVSYKCVFMDSADIFKISSYKLISCTLYYLITTHKWWQTYCHCLGLLSRGPQLHSSCFKGPPIAKGWKSLSLWEMDWSK